MVEVIGTVFKGRKQFGDFEWHIQSGQFEDSLFLFNDDEKRNTWRKAGMGNAVIRKYNKHALAKPRSCGIITGNDVGYTELTPSNKAVIDQCFTEIKEILREHGYTKVYYSAQTENGRFGTSIFHVGDDVIEYITNEIHMLKC